MVYIAGDEFPPREFILETVLINLVSDDSSDESASSTILIFLSFLGHLAAKLLLHYAYINCKFDLISPFRVYGHKICTLVYQSIVPFELDYIASFSFQNSFASDESFLLLPLLLFDV